MTKYDIATQGKSVTKQRIPSIVDDPSHAYYPTDNWLGDVPSSHRVVVAITTIWVVFSISGQVNSQGQSREYILELYSQTI
jgi:hypothetical protein